RSVYRMAFLDTLSPSPMKREGTMSADMQLSRPRSTAQTSLEQQTSLSQEIPGALPPATITVEGGSIAGSKCALIWGRTIASMGVRFLRGC
ncbi:MAG TPA: hypothetical protein PK162_02195, partial [Synergistales bacterium]|nr:hypothetical protein [Synergistales bacterium]